MDSILQKGGASYDEMQGGIWVPGTSDVVLVPGETVPLTDVVMAGDPNLVPENIKLGVSIFDVLGTWNEFQSEDGYYLKGENYMVDVTGDYGKTCGLHVSSGRSIPYSYANGTKQSFGLQTSAGMYLISYDDTGEQDWIYIWSGFSSLMYTNNKIDMTNIRTISALVTNTTASGQMGDTKGSGAGTLGIASYVGNMGGTGTRGGGVTSVASITFGNVTEQIVTLNVEQITGSYYVYVGSCTYTNPSNRKWYTYPSGNPGGACTTKVKQIMYETMPTV